MIKPDRWIREWGRNGGVTPFEESQVNSASYDVRVSDHWICPTREPGAARATFYAATRARLGLAIAQRIATAADDAAGLAISERLRAQVRSLDQAKRNAQDGTGLGRVDPGAGPWRLRAAG